MSAPPINLAFSPDSNPPVKKFRAGGTPANIHSTQPRPPPPPPQPQQQGANAAGGSSTMRASEAISNRREELLKLRQKTASRPATPGGPPPPPSSSTSHSLHGGRISTEDLLNRARAQLPPPRVQHVDPGTSRSAPHPTQGPPKVAAAASGPAPPVIPFQDPNHFRRTSDIFPEVTSKVNAPPKPPVTTATPGPPAGSPPAPSFQPFTPAVPRNLDPSFAHDDGAAAASSNELRGAAPVPPPPPAPPTSDGVAATAAGRGGPPPPVPSPRPKSAPPQRPVPPTNACATAGATASALSPPKSPGSGASHRPPPPGRPKAVPHEEIHPSPTKQKTPGPPPKGPPPPPRPMMSVAPPLEDEPASDPTVGKRPPVAIPPATSGIPNGSNHLDQGSSHSRGAPRPPPRPFQQPQPQKQPSSPVRSNPSVSTEVVGVSPARVPHPLMVDTRIGVNAASVPSTAPDLADVEKTTATTGATLPQIPPEESILAPAGGFYAPTPALYQAERYLASTLRESNSDDDDAALLDGAKTPPINNQSLELRLQKEIAQLQKDKSEALRRVVELEERIHDLQNQQPPPLALEEKGPNGESGLLQTILHLAETEGEGAALGWAHDQLLASSDGVDSLTSLPGGGVPPFRSVPVVPRPRRSPAEADLPPEVLRAAASNVEHEYVADCATYIVRRPYDLAVERELWFKAGNAPAKRYAEAATVMKVPSLEVAAVIRVDGSILSISGIHLVRHESNGEWHDFGPAVENGESLGLVTLVDGDTGEEIQYSLDEVYEGAVAVREQYCLSVLSNAAGIHSASKADKNRPKNDADQDKIDSAKQAEPKAVPVPAPEGDSVDVLRGLFDRILSLVLSLAYHIVAFPLRVVSSAAAILMAMTLLSILWGYVADEYAMGQSAYWYNQPNIV